MLLMLGRVVVLLLRGQGLLALNCRLVLAGGCDWGHQPREALGTLLKTLLRPLEAPQAPVYGPAAPLLLLLLLLLVAVLLRSAVFLLLPNIHAAF
jgi:hypothetical protein